jgi:hypothetical protein
MKKNVPAKRKGRKMIKKEIPSAFLPPLSHNTPVSFPSPTSLPPSQPMLSKLILLLVVILVIIIIIAGLLNDPNDNLDLLVPAALMLCRRFRRRQRSEVAPVLLANVTHQVVLAREGVNAALACIDGAVELDSVEAGLDAVAVLDVPNSVSVSFMR